MSLIGDYNQIMSDRKIFNDVVYTPLSEAIKLLEERRNNPELIAKVEKLLNGDIPGVLKNNKCAVLCRQIATPNYDSLLFVSVASDNNLKPTFFEYIDDKFVSDNEFKHSLGQLRIHKGIDKAGNFIEEKISVIDFNKSNGKKIKDLITLEGESLVQFHKKLFNVHNINPNDLFFIDGSDWVNKNGKKATEYYSNLFLFFVCHGILFENFFITKNSEGDFTKNILLPAIKRVIEITGVKPLIVPISPIDLEENRHCFSYDQVIKPLLVK